MQKALLASLLQWTLWGLAMALVTGWIARSRLRERPASELGTLRHPPSTLWIGIVCMAFFFGIAVFANTAGKNSTTNLWITLFFIGFGLMGLPMITDYFFGRHSLSEHGLAYGRMFGQRGTLAWKDVRRLRFSQTMKWFVLDGASGDRVRVSAMLMGLPDFATLVLLHVPAEALDDDTREVLEHTRAGALPRF